MITFLLVIGWIAVAAISFVALMRHIELMDARARPRTRRRVVVIVPLTHVDALTGPFLERVLTQDHPNYRIVFAVQSRSDDTGRVLAGLTSRSYPRVEIAQAGASVGCAQSAWNMIVALEHLAPSDRLVVFAEPHSLPPRDWLSLLDWGVIDERQPVLTALPLVVPARPSLAGYVAASINLSAVGAVRPGRLAPAWNGTMAMTQETIRQIDLKRAWAGAMSADGALAEAMAAKHLPIATQRAALLEVPWEGGVRDALAFGRRQFMVLLKHRPQAYWLGLLAALVPWLAGIVVVQGAATGNRWDIALLVLAAGLGLLRARLRHAVVRRVLTPEAMAGQRGWLRFDIVARPLWWTMLVVVMLSALVGRRMSVGGTTYEWTADRGARIVGRRP